MRKEERHRSLLKVEWEGIRKLKAGIGRLNIVQNILHEILKEFKIFIFKYTYTKIVYII